MVTLKMLFTHIFGSTTPSLSAFCPQFPYPTVWRKRTLSGHQAQTGPPPKKWGLLLTHFPFSCMPSELSCPRPPIPEERIPGEEALDTHTLSLPNSHTDFPPSNNTIFSAGCGCGRPWLQLAERAVTDLQIEPKTRV
ncbi:hypothetical protein M747DRAFT_298644 [Aspergillus niger ATCC 13496]|uniref:Uncharacterized protein n=2 Tax=Aspergillus niger TaxID=5061 RepID=A0A370BTG0_ASPNG|nr:hypothetical protein M747DRAFT_298644 [Aspergillus niger ATCC 13496]